MPTRILLIEDDPDVTTVLTYALNDAGYETITAATAMNGLISAREDHPDLVLLDLGLPDFDGSEVASRLRSTNGDVPVIVLTAMDAVERKVKLLSNGANDYITKPFEPNELLARINVQLRRRNVDIARLGPLEVRFSTREVRWEHRGVPLSPKEYDIIAFLARNPGRVYSRDELMREFWPELLDSASNTLHVHLAHIRRKFEEVGATRVIRTVRGMGVGLYTEHLTPDVRTSA